MLLPDIVEPAAHPPLLQVLWLAVALLLVPVLLEEGIARGLLIRFDASGQVVVWSVPVSVAAYVGWHPITALAIMPAAVELFFDLRFLLIVGLLGSACAFLYIRSRSLWPGAFLHWMIVFGWKALGGERYLI